MRKTLALIRKEFLQRVRGKGFWIGTLALPVFFVGLSFVPAFFMHLSAGKESKVVVVDLTRRLEQVLQANATDTRLKMEVIPADSAQLPTLKEQLSRRISRGEIDAALFVPASATKPGTVSLELYAKNVSNFELNNALKTRVSEAVVEIRLLDSGFDPMLVRQLTRGLELKTFKVGKTGVQQRSAGAEFMIVYLLVFSLYMTLIFYGTFVMRGVIEEKSSRAVETILSMVRPSQLMAGKILGIGAVGLVQYFLWLVMIILFLVLGQHWLQSVAGVGGSVGSIPAGTLAAFVVFFVLGYLLFSTLWAALGSIVNSESEAQQLQFPLVMLLVIPFMAMFYVINAPNTTVSVVLSLVPFFAPILMFLRIAVDPPALWQVALSVVLLVLTIWGAIWVVGRIFRVGILMTGKRPTLPEILRWLRHA
ncbi:MAG: ABC transporter permease [Calditrichaeota bacterium]|nr:ABC transporter permease [Calditrichota bacterium]